MHIDFDDWNPVDYIAVFGAVLAILGFVAMLVTDEPPHNPPDRWTVRLGLGGFLLGGLAIIGDVIARKLNIDDWVGFAGVMVILSLLTGWGLIVRHIVSRKAEPGKDNSAVVWKRGLEAARVANEAAASKISDKTGRKVYSYMAEVDPKSLLVSLQAAQAVLKLWADQESADDHTARLQHLVEACEKQL
jgi:hypothetical protein